VVALDFAPAQRRSRRRCRYQSQGSWQTLAEGLAEYYAANRGRGATPDELSPEAAALIRSHDICHVIFGLDTTPADEAIADIRALLCCDVGWKRFSVYLAAEATAKAVLKSPGHAKGLANTLVATPRAIRALMQSWRMRKRWPWNPPEDFLERQLSELREDYRIEVI